MSRKHLTLMAAGGGPGCSVSEPTSTPKPAVRLLKSDGAVKFWDAGATVARALRARVIRGLA